MADFEITVPQIGEGLKEALIVRLLKQPGDPVERDEAVFEMETDKATQEIESPRAGTLREWLVEAGEVVPIGATVALLEVAAGESPTEQAESPASGTSTAAPDSSPPASQDRKPRPSAGLLRIPPRTRALARRAGLSEEELAAIPHDGNKLLPADVENYLAQRGKAPAASAAAEGARDYPLPPRQRAFAYRLRRSAQLVVPATLTRLISHGDIRDAEARLRKAHPELILTGFEIFAHAVARATRQHPKFRSVFLDDENVREFHHARLGIAVQQPGDELLTAALDHADQRDFPDFVQALQQTVARALGGEDQADANIPLLLSFLADGHVIRGVPTLVAPAVATLFVGAPYEIASGGQVVEATLTFDHRLINGAGAAAFLDAVADEIQALAGMEKATPLPQEPTDDAPPASTENETEILETVSQCIAELRGQPLSAAEQNTPVFHLGLSSLQSVELANRLARRFQREVLPTLVWNHPTPVAIAAHLAGQPQQTNQTKPSAKPPRKSLDDLLDEVE